jgi:hypothetical protein
VLLSIEEYAKHRGVDARAVRYALERGRISTNSDRLIETTEADADWEKNTNHRNARYGPKTKHRPVLSAARLPNPPRKSSPAAREVAEEAQAAIPSGGGISFAQARAAKEVYEARLKKIELEKAQGDLLPRRQIEIHAFNVHRITRDAILNIPIRIATQLAGEPDPMTVTEILEAELRLVLNQLAEALSTYGREREEVAS